MPVVITGPEKLVPGSDAKQVLERFGARVPIVLAIPEVQADAIRAAGGTVPDPVSGLALIDTGCTVTSIDEGVAAHLALKPSGFVDCNNAGGLRKQAPQYVVHAVVDGQAGGLWTMTEATLAPGGMIALIGTDILKHTVFVFDGVSGAFSLTIHSQT